MLDFSYFGAFPNDIILKCDWKTKNCFGWVENIVGTGENAVTIISSFPTMFSKASP